MAENLVINEVTYPDVKAISVETEAGGQAMYYPDAVRYVEQTLTAAQKAQARTNIGAASSEEVSQLSEEIANQQEQLDGKQPRGNYLTAVPDGYVTDAELQAEVTARELAVADLNARLGQQTVLIAEGETQADAEAWLESNADKTKVYLMPDETFWQYRKVTEVVESGGVAYTNQLPLATDTDRKTIFNGKGYQLEKRLSSSSGSVSSVNTGVDCGASGFIPAKVDDTFEIQGGYPPIGVAGYLITYDSSNVKVGFKDLWGSNGVSWGNDDNAPWQKYDAERNVLTIKLTSEYFGTGFDAIRFSAGGIDENTIVTINEEIRESSGTTTTIVEKWATTGHGLTATNYDAVIATINNTLNAHTEEINALRELIENGMPENVDSLDLIRNWDAPIYDANIPLFQLSTEKAGMTEVVTTPDSIYAMYDALMAKHPEYITKTDLGLCSDGVNHVYRYDFREPEPYHQSNMQWSETKIKAILVSGIHYEWDGIYSLYYALEEIAENPSLFDLRRNTHFIVVPVVNPYCIPTANYNASIGVLNANGVQIHRNFEVGFIYPNESGYVALGERNHGGTEPLSEVETQYIDNILKANADSAFFLTCHNFDTDSTYGISFIWPSTATKYMCNMGNRLIDKMSKAWLDKYGDELEAGIADYKTDAISDNHIRFGHAHVSSTNGTETRQATKYGIQGTNVEVCHRFYAHGTKSKVEEGSSSFTLSRGAETYINFLLTACGVYDYKDKKEYFK